MNAPAISFESALENTVSDNRLVGLWRLMAGFRLTYVGATVSEAAAAGFNIATFLLLQYFVDNVLGQKELSRVLPLIALSFVGLALLRGAFTFLSSWLSARTAEGITLRLRNCLFDHVQRLPSAYHDRTQSGELIQRVTSDVDALRRLFAYQAIGVGRILLLFVIHFTALTNLDMKLALLSITTVPLVVAVSWFFLRKVSNVYEDFQRQEARLSIILQENLSGVREVKAFARQAYERDRFWRGTQEQLRRGQELAMTNSVYWSLLIFLGCAQKLGCLFVGALMTIDGTVTVGTYLAYAGLIEEVIWPIGGLGLLVGQIAVALVSYGRVAEVAKEAPEPLTKETHTPLDDIQGEVAFRNVSFRYGSSKPVLSDICFRCEPGQVVALLGPTGSGKTSLVNLLLRFYDYSVGNIALDGVELKEYPRHFLRQRIGIVDQEPFLFSRTIWENIAYGAGRDVSPAEIEAAARAAAIHDVVVSFPDGYETLVGEKGVTLSGGQRQRLVIARTLLKDPRILILDDATSSVDAETEREIRQALGSLMRGRTTFIVTHRVQSAMNADLILVLNQGRIVQQGTHDALIGQPGFYRQIYDEQARIDSKLEREVASATAQGL